MDFSSIKNFAAKIRLLSETDKMSVPEGIQAGIKKDEASCKERFVHVTDLEITNKNCKTISDYGQLRWKIENEGFNEQTNSGYKLSHKYSRKSFNATQNYYRCLQIAHMINQLAHKTKRIQNMIDSRDTLKSFEECIIVLMIACNLADFPSVNINWLML